MASGARTGDQPLISAIAAYSTLLSPEYVWWKRFQRPRRRASALSSSMTGGCVCGPCSARWAAQTGSAGITCSVMKSHICSLISAARGDGVKSIGVSRV